MYASLSLLLIYIIISTWVLWKRHKSTFLLFFVYVALAVVCFLTGVFIDMYIYSVTSEDQTAGLVFAFFLFLEHYLFL